MRVAICKGQLHFDLEEYESFISLVLPVLKNPMYRALPENQRQKRKRLRRENIEVTTLLPQSEPTIINLAPRSSTKKVTDPIPAKRISILEIFGADEYLALVMQVIIFPAKIFIFLDM